VTIRGVNTVLTILRSFEWSGGSMLSIICCKAARSLGLWSRRNVAPACDE
jgi:hypothetical protein